MAEEKKPAAPKAAAPKKEAAPKKPVAEKAEAKAVKAPKEAAPKKEVAPKKEAAPKAAAPKKEAAPKAEKVKKEVAILSIKAPAKKTAPKKDAYQARFKTQYEEKIRPTLLKEFGYKSSMAIPRIVKIVINSGVGDAVSDKNVVDNAQNDLTIIAAQKAVKTIARKSVSNFKLREGMPIGVKVTLRGNRMFDFLDKVISTALPRVRDFRGVKSSGFDGRGNFTFGLREQIVFPEINYDKIDKVRGMDISIVTTAKTDAEARSLLNQFGFPFRAK